MLSVYIGSAIRGFRNRIKFKLICAHKIFMPSHIQKHRQNQYLYLIIVQFLLIFHLNSKDTISINRYSYRKIPNFCQFLSPAPVKVCTVNCPRRFDFSASLCSIISHRYLFCHVLLGYPYILT